MSERVDYFVFDKNFTGPAYVVYGVHGGTDLEWSEDHNGWVLPIPAHPRFLLTSLPIDDKSVQSGAAMWQDNATADALPFKQPTQDQPFAFTGPRSTILEIPLDGGQVARFFAQSLAVACDPCPQGVVPAVGITRESVRDAAIAELDRRLRSEVIPHASLDIIEE